MWDALSLWLSLATAPSPVVVGTKAPEQLLLVGAGDIADCSVDDDEQTARLVERHLQASKNAVAFTLGDDVYPEGSLDQFRRCYEPTWGRFKERTLPVVGNHEYLTQNAAGFRAYFAEQRPADAPLWWSTDVQGQGSDGAAVRWHIVVLDSNCDKVDCQAGSPQHQFVAHDLATAAAKTADCTIAMFHHPRFSSGPHGDATAMTDLWAALAEGGVDLALSGHDHIYERFPPLDAKGQRDDAHGIASIVVGTGGRSHYPALLAHRHSAVRFSDAFGVLVLEPHRLGAKVQFVGVDGTVKDVHELRCDGHSAAAPAATSPRPNGGPSRSSSP